MPLIDLWKTNPDAVSQFSVEQVVAVAGNANLLDSSICSSELRAYLRSARSERIFEYVDECLTRGFNKSGAVLQDLVNELGRRLDYQVENGLYQGRANAIGFDGIWTAPDRHSLVVEVKTTDAYRINLDTIANYREALGLSGRIALEKSSILIVVGRNDTGDIEAQVRGSKHAWDIRLISADALVKLVKLKESADEEETVAKIRGILRPFEYTRLDNIIDVMFTAAKDVEASSELEGGAGATADIEHGAASVQARTDPSLLNSIRKRVMGALGRREGADLIAKSRALYWSADETLRACCAISKRHERGTYWYAYHLHWDQFLSGSNRSYSVWGCVDRDIAYVVPRSFMVEVLEELYTTRRDSGQMYWHVELELGDGGEMYFLVRKSGRRLPVASYGMSLSAPHGS